jgi:hypothetical protein
VTTGDDPRQWRRVVGRVVTVLAALVVLAALILPSQPGFTPGTLLRIPVEVLVAVALVLLLPARAGRIVAGIGGALVGLLAVMKVFDIGFFSVLDRPFDPMGDWPFLTAGADYLSRSHGRTVEILAIVGAVALAVGLLVVMTLAGVRLARVVKGHRTPAVRTVAVLGVVWVVAAAFGAPFADRNTSVAAYEHAAQVGFDIRDHGQFASQMATDSFRDLPASQLLTGLRGKDVVLAYVESYGRVALEDPQISPGVQSVLSAGWDKLRAAGFSAKTGWLTSSTYAGGSWLAHSTLESGVWVNSQQRFLDYAKSDRFTLDSAFARAGWRTVDVEPANIGDAPGPKFDKVYDERDLGYRGERFTFNSMPDQYTLAKLQEQELSAPGHVPVFSRIVMLSSHAPWSPVPQLSDWNNVGVGYEFKATPESAGRNWDLLAPDRTEVRTDYGHSVEYSLSTLISYVMTYGDDNLVLVFLGDHQPDSVVTGPTTNRDVPITIIAHDPKVLDRIAGWGWQDGIRPTAAAPVWRMDAFRDQFLTAFGTRP